MATKEPTKELTTWDELRASLKRVTMGYGAKAALARKFKVKQASVSEWLSGESAPTADTTLQLRGWVIDEEAKQNKSPGGASTPPRRKTRKTKSYETKSSSSRKKG